MYSEELADVYELLYAGRGKDWKAEAAGVAALVRERCPDAHTLLDVACGTGAHLEGFAAHFGAVEGLEIAAPMRERAGKRLPGVALHAGDMRDFRLDHTFDAVTCMFVAISYVDSLAGMRSAVRCMAQALRPGGVLVIEPWWFPHEFLDGHVAGDLVRDAERTVTRVSHSSLRDGATHMEVRFTVGDARGIRQFAEVDVMQLFTEQEYLDAFADAGCPAQFITGGPVGRLFVGVRDQS